MRCVHVFDRPDGSARVYLFTRGPWETYIAGTFDLMFMARHGVEGAVAYLESRHGDEEPER